MAATIATCTKTQEVVGREPGNRGSPTRQQNARNNLLYISERPSRAGEPADLEQVCPPNKYF